MCTFCSNPAEKNGRKIAQNFHYFYEGLLGKASEFELCFSFQITCILCRLFCIILLKGYTFVILFFVDTKFPGVDNFGPSCGALGLPTVETLSFSELEYFNQL